MKVPVKRKCRKCGYLRLRAAPGAATAAPALAVQQPDQHRLEAAHDDVSGSDGGYDDDTDSNDASTSAVRLPRLNDLVRPSVAAAATLDAASVSCASTAP